MSATTTRSALARADFAALDLYEADRAPASVDLSDNTNRWGMPPAAARVLRETPASTFTRYPDAYAAPLKHAIARYCGVGASSVVTGCGSDDVLDSAVRAVAAPGERLAACDPTFVIVPGLAVKNGLLCARVPFAATLDIDPGALLAAGARIVYVCSPNNPTGTVASLDAITRLADAHSGLVIVDEAYVEFTDGPGCIELARSRPNVLVVRTMSKAFGLAGLRVGYGVGAPALVREVEKARGPYKVGAAAALGAQAALDEDVAWMRVHARLARETRARLETELRGRRIETLPSSANFVLARVAGAPAIARRMRDAGVAVRSFTALRGIGDALRITVGPPEEMAAALAALDQAMTT